MNKESINTKDQSKLGAGWMTIGMGICILLLLITVPIVIILSLIPLYVNKSTAGNVNSYATAASGIAHSLSSSFLPSSGASSLTATNLDSMARQLETAYGLDTGTLSVSSGGLSSFPKSRRRRRHQNHREKRAKPSCDDLGYGGSVMDFQLSVNYPKRLGNSAVAKLKFLAAVMNILSKPLTGIAITVSFNDGSSSTITFTACTKSASSTLFSNSTNTCTNGVRNGLETDVDCGGNCPKKCADSKKCKVAADCSAGICGSDSKCAVSKCTDGVTNGDETDVDCGGSCSAKCADTKTCKVAADCTSGVCTSSKCAAPSCSDAVKNGNETDLDCGGYCGGTCAVNKTCSSHLDCAKLVCYNGTCADCANSAATLLTAVTAGRPIGSAFAQYTGDLIATTWTCKSINVSFTAAGNLNFLIRLTPTTGDLFSLDDVSMYSTSNGIEMVQNGGFETSVAGTSNPPWTLAVVPAVNPIDGCTTNAAGTAAPITDPTASKAHNGTNYIKSVAGEATCGDFVKYSNASVPILANQGYIFVFWAKSATANAASILGVTIATKELSTTAAGYV